MGGRIQLAPCLARLQHDGYNVYAPPRPLRGLLSDSAYLHPFLTDNAASKDRRSYGSGIRTVAR